LTALPTWSIATNPSGCVILYPLLVLTKVDATPFAFSNLRIIMSFASTRRFCISNIVTSLVENSVTRIIILNGHHGNAQLLGRVRDTWGVLSYWHFMKHEFDHAGFVETSLMLAISDKVKMKKAKKGLITKGLSEKEIQRINKLSTQPGGFPKVTKNGVWGDPTSATKKDGEKFLAEIVKNLAKECQS